MAARKPTPKPTPKQRYDAIMQGAGEKMRVLNEAALKRERAFRMAAKESLQTERRGDIMGEAPYASLLLVEIDAVTSRLKRETSPEERIGLRAELAHLRRLLVALRDGGWPGRRPPEAGLPVPAVPPRGPLPMQGGAAAPLDFDA